MANLQGQGRWYNNNHTCVTNGHEWVEYKVKEGLSAPHCAVGSFGRINHLGNVPTSSAVNQQDLDAIPHRNNANRFIWTIPDHVNDNCVLRLRYNISTADYLGWDMDGTPGYNASYNKQPPIQQDPYIDIGTEEDEFVSLMRRDGRIKPRDMSDRVLGEIFREVDRDHSGEVSHEEFELWITAPQVLDEEEKARFAATLGLNGNGGEITLDFPPPTRALAR